MDGTYASSCLPGDQLRTGFEEQNLYGHRSSATDKPFDMMPETLVDILFACFLAFFYVLGNCLTLYLALSISHSYHDLLSDNIIQYLYTISDKYPHIGSDLEAFDLTFFVVLQANIHGATLGRCGRNFTSNVFCIFNESGKYLKPFHLIISSQWFPSFLCYKTENSN